MCHIGNADTLKALQSFGVSEKLHGIGIPVNGFTMHINGRVISQVHYVVDKQDVTHPICLPVNQLVVGSTFAAGAKISIKSIIY